MTLTQRLERAIRHVLADALQNNGSTQAVQDTAVYVGSTLGDKTLPCVVVSVDRMAAQDAMPVGEGLYEAGISVMVLTQGDEEDMDAHTERVEIVRAALEDEPALLAALNYPGSPDNRPTDARDLHVYQCEVEQREESREERCIITAFSLRAPCQGVDGPAP